MVVSEMDHNGRCHVHWDWIGEYEVPVSGNCKISPYRQDCNGTDYETVLFRKKFTDARDFEETVREAYPKHAILAHEKDTQSATTKVTILLLDVVFAVPALVVPALQFFGPAVHDNGSPLKDDWLAGLAYLIIVGLANTTTALETLDDSRSRAALVVSGEQELPELDTTDDSECHQYTCISTKLISR